MMRSRLACGALIALGMASGCALSAQDSSWEGQEQAGVKSQAVARPIPDLDSDRAWSQLGSFSDNVLSVMPTSYFPMFPTEGPPPTLFVGTQSSGILKSTLSGASWTTFNEGLATAGAPGLPAIRQLGRIVHGGFVSAEYYAATDTGLFWRDAISGTSWQRVSINGSTSRPVSGFAISPLASLYSMRFMFVATPEGVTWTPASPNTGIFTSFGAPRIVNDDPSQAPLVYSDGLGESSNEALVRVMQQGSQKLYRVIASTGIYGVNSITEMAAVPGQVVAFYRYQGAVLALTADSGVYRSTNNGQSWLFSSSGFNFWDSPARMIFSNTNPDSGPSGSGPLYLVTQTALYFSTDAGLSWSPMDTCAMQGAQYLSGAMSDGNHLYLGQERYFFEGRTLGGGLFMTLGGSSPTAYPSECRGIYLDPRELGPRDEPAFGPLD